MKWRLILSTLSLVVSILLVSSVLLFAGSGATVVVSTNSVKAVPAAGMVKTAPTYATNTAYTQGQYVKHEGRIFMALNAGTSGVASPSGVRDSSDGTITWRSALSRERKGLVIVNGSSTGVLYVAEAPVSSGVGVRLVANGAFATSGEGTPQGEYWFQMVGGTGVVSHFEW